MITKSKTKSSIFEAVHETASDLHRLGFIDKVIVATFTTTEPTKPSGFNSTRPDASAAAVEAVSAAAAVIAVVSVSACAACVNSSISRAVRNEPTIWRALIKVNLKQFKFDIAVFSKFCSCAVDKQKFKYQI